MFGLTLMTNVSILLGKPYSNLFSCGLILNASAEIEYETRS
jgi:hypothetical protein